MESCEGALERNGISAIISFLQPDHDNSFELQKSSAQVVSWVSAESVRTPSVPLVARPNSDRVSDCDIAGLRGGGAVEVVGIVNGCKLSCSSSKYAVKNTMQRLAWDRNKHCARSTEIPLLQSIPRQQSHSSVASKKQP
jgi:hypothetical protein